MLQEFEKNNMDLSLEFLKKEGKNALTLGRLEYILGQVSEFHERHEKINLSFTLKTPKLHFIFGISGLEFNKEDKISVLRVYKGTREVQNNLLEQYDLKRFNFTTILQQIVTSYDYLIKSSQKDFDIMNQNIADGEEKIKSIIFPDYHNPKEYVSVNSLQEEIDKIKKISQDIPGFDWKTIPCCIESTFFPTGFMMIEIAATLKNMQEETSPYIGASFVCDSFNPEEVLFDFIG
jgi:hypothetical protein